MLAVFVCFGGISLLLLILVWIFVIRPFVVDL
jgi:hypothetical protein